MQEARAVARQVRISPHKARQVIDLVRNQDVNQALSILRNSPKKAAGMISKVIKSAQANAEHNLELDGNEMYVKEAYVDEGPVMKRIKPRAMGRADMIRKPTSHITIVLCVYEDYDAVEEA